MILGMPLLEVVRSARIAKAQTGRSILAQFVDIIRLRLSRHALFAEDYFKYRLFDPSRSWDEKRRYVGLWARDRLYRIQDRDWMEIAEDKLKSDRHLRARGFPVPRILAHSSSSAVVEGARPLSTVPEIADWLRNDAPYPIFAKPAVGYLGYSAMLIDGHDAAQDRLLLRDGQSVDVIGFAEALGIGKRGGMIFQEVLRPHPLLAERIGDRLATARLVIIGRPGQRRLYAGGIRFPVGRSMTDNLQGGSSGNLLGRVDFGSGEVTEVLSGFGLQHALNPVHPDTGATLAGFRIPDWNAAVALAVEASETFAGLPIQGWDAAFTERGPVLVECNATGSVHLPQLAMERGLAQPEFLALYDGGRL